MSDPADRKTSKTAPKRRKTWFIFSLALFFFATLMGTGPGVFLVSGEGSLRFFAGIPILYAWVALWFLVMVASILLLAWSGTLGETDTRSEEPKAVSEKAVSEKEEKR